MLDRFRVLASGLDHPEGVAVGPDGRVWAGGEAGQVYAVRDGSAEIVARTGGFVLGLAVDASSRIYVCDVGRGTVLRVTPEATVGPDGATVEPYARYSDGGMAAPNWLAFGPDGALFVTDSGDWGAGDGRIWRIEPDGTARVWTTEVPRLPNGCCVDGDGSGLFVIETNGPGIVRVPIRADGSAGQPEHVVDLPGTVPDGLALLADGSLLVACYRPDALLRVSGGRVETIVEDETGQLLGAPTNVAFAPGPSGRLDRLMVANLGRWHVVTGEDLPFEGAALPYPELP